MEKKQHNNISENQVEDSLVSNLLYLRRLINSKRELKLIARQLRLKKGENRIDILVLDGNDLCLIELKVVKFSIDFLSQIINYRNELINLQNNRKLVKGNIKSYLLVTKATKKEVELAKNQNVSIILYEPLDVMIEYYKNLSTVAPFLNIKPNDYGVMTIGKINILLKLIDEGISTERELSEENHLSKGSIHNHLKLAKEFGLVRKKNQAYSLTDLGDKYISNSNAGILLQTLTKNQIELLKQFISNDPFYSSTIFGIYSIVDSAFILSRNSYPIDLEDLQKMFQIVGGKVTEWISERTIQTATYTFISFATELELLGKIGKQLVITPSGFKFILMLQLHKSIEMIESLTLNN